MTTFDRLVGGVRTGRVWAWLPGLALVPLALVAAWIAGRFVLALHEPLHWASDLGIFLIDSENALRLSQAIGTSSRFGWAHPGPLNYYLLAPFYAAGGAVGLMLGTFLLNVACIGGSAWLIRRMSDGVTALVFLLATTMCMVACFDLASLWTPLIPHATIPVWIAVVVLSCYVVHAGFRWSVPWTLALCFVTQAHVAFWLPAAVTVAATVAMAVARGHRDFRGLVAAGVLAIVLWLPPLLEWHNLSLIFRHFASAGPAPHTWAEAFLAFCTFTGEGASGSTPLFGAPTDASFARVGAAALILAAVACSASRPKSFPRIVGVFVAALAAVDILSLTRFTGPILPHSVLFMMTIAPLCGLVLFSAFPTRQAPRYVVVLAVVALWSAVSIWNMIDGHVAAALRSHPGVAELGAEIRTALEERPGVQTIDIDRDADVWPTAVGALSDLYRSRVPFAITPSWKIVFSGHVPTFDRPDLRIVRDGNRLQVVVVR